MRAAFALGVVVALFLGLNATVQAEDKSDPREDLVTLIPEAIRLLKNEKYEEFYRSFVDAQKLEETDEETRRKGVEEWAANKAAMLLKIFQAIEGTEPQLDKHGKMAWFAHGVKGAPFDTIVFEKVGKHWRILNISPPRAAEQRNAADSR